MVKGGRYMSASERIKFKNGPGLNALLPTILLKKHSYHGIT